MRDVKDCTPAQVVEGSRSGSGRTNGRGNSDVKVGPRQAALASQLSGAVEAEIRRRAHDRISKYYPDDGLLRRELYVPHLAFFAAGKDHRERLMLAANRVGKTEGVGAYETTLHLTGNYPKWWVGRRWNRPIRAVAAGDTNLTVRDIIQAKLLGQIVREAGDDPDKPIGLGTGMIPGDLIRSVKPRPGVPNAMEMAYVKHSSGGTSLITLKSYEQGREAYQGTEQDLIWLDEEPSLEIYIECLMRTMTTDGLLMLTFTPLNGLTPLIEQFLPGGRLNESA